MKRIARPLYALVPDPALRERLRRAAEGRWSWTPLQDWGALGQAVRGGSPAALVVVDPYTGMGPKAGPAEELRALIRMLPSLTVVAYLQERPGWLSHARALGEWGVAELIDAAIDDTPLAVRLRLLRVQGRPLRELVEGCGLRLRSPARARALLGAAVDVVATGGSAADLARDLGVSEDTLLRWCRGSGLPPPRRLLLWLRVLLAAELLDNPGRTVMDAALGAGYASDNVLRQALRTVVGATPTELRNAGAWRGAASAFAHALEVESWPAGG